MHLVKMEFGSRLYGTSTPESDIDYKGIHVPFVREILFGNAKRSVQTKTKHLREVQVDGKIGRNIPGDVDFESRTLMFFMENILEGQPISRDMLFAPEQNLLKVSSEWYEICTNKDKLLHRNINFVLDYCNKQVRKYGTKGSRVAELRKLVEFLEKLDGESRLTDHEQSLEELVKDCDHIKLSYTPYTDIRRLLCCGKSMPVTALVKTVIRPFLHMLQQYGQRSLQAEKNEGIDWKAVSHAVRVYQETIELLKEGIITFPRPNANYLLRIKQGELPFSDVSELLEELKAETIDTATRSSLPDKANIKWIEDFVLNVYREQVINSSI